MSDIERELKIKFKTVARKGLLPAILLTATISGGYLIAEKMAELKESCIEREVLTPNNLRGPNYKTSERGCALFLSLPPRSS